MNYIKAGQQNIMVRYNYIICKSCIVILRHINPILFKGCGAEKLFGSETLGLLVRDVGDVVLPDSFQPCCIAHDLCYGTCGNDKEDW